MTRQPGFLKHLERAAEALAFSAPLAVYASTLPLGLTWANDGADGGDLIAAAATLGIPHPPGYPLYTLLARVFLAIPWGTLAHRVALLSAVAGAGAAWAVYRLCLIVLTGARQSDAVSRQMMKPLTELLRPCLIAMAASLIWAFAPIAWGQAIIAEVYALSVLLAVAFLAALLHWRRAGGLWVWRGAWLLFGLGMAHHLLIAVCLIPAALWAWDQRSRLGGRRWAEAAGLFAAGLCFYVYLPARAAASPPINWGDPRTLPGFWWVVSATPYRHFVFGLPLVEWPARISAWAGILTAQFKVWGVALGFWGALALHERDKTASWGLLGLFAAVSVYAVGYNTTDSYVYLLPALAVFAAWVAVGLGDIWGRVVTLQSNAPRLLLAGAAIVLLALPTASLALNWEPSDISRDREAQDYVDQSLAVLPVNAVVLAEGDRETFALWYTRWAVGGPFRGEVISVPLLQFEWYRAQVQARDPALVIPPSTLQEEVWLAAFLDANINGRDVFLTTDSARIGGAFALQPAGPLFKVQKK